MFEAAFMQVALAASIAGSVSLGLMGVYLSVRRMVFLGLVLANAATAGAALAQVLGWPPQVTAAGVSLVAALGLGALPPARRVAAESVVGWAYSAAASAAVLILAGAAAGEADTMHLLYGNVLAVSPSHALGLVGVTVAVLVVHALFGRRFLLVTFDEEAAQVAGINTRQWAIALSLAIGVPVAAAVLELGALLTFALLTLAPMASLLVAERVRTTFLMAAIIGSLAVCSGLILAFQWDLPPGPLSVGVLVVVVIVAAAIRCCRS
jgi:ABC-type Mn2+/Zn2+ transport system permease subunit